MARTELIESIWEHRSHQRCVADRQSGAGRLDPYYLFIVFLYPHDQTRLAKEREVMRKRCVVSSVLKLSKHFLIGQYLAGIRTGQRKELTQATRTLTTSVPLTDNCQSEQLHFLVAVWRSAFHSDSCRFVCREGGVRVRRNDETRRVGDGVDAAPGAATARRGHGSAKSPSGDSSLRRIRGRA